MSYEKRVCILRQVRKGFSADGSALTGAVYCERLGEELTVTPRIAALSPLRDGRYALYLWADGKIFCLELRGGAPLHIEHAPTLAHGVAARLCFVKGEAQPVAFGRCGDAPERYAALLDGECPRRIPVPLPPVQTPAPAPNVPLAPAVPLPEFPPEEEDGAKKGGASRKKSAAPSGEGGASSPQSGRAAARYDDDALAAGDYFAHAGDGDEKTAAAGAAQDGAAADGDAGDLLLRPRKSLTYYRSVKEKLDAAFASGERDTRLCAVFPRSEWVKKGNALLGLVWQEDGLRWLCVAAEGERPKEMGERAVFVPAAPFSDERGFWVVFQDADTGEYVTVCPS